MKCDGKEEKKVMQEVLKLPKLFPVVDADFLKRRLLYGAVVLTWVMLLSFFAEDCYVQNREMMYENYDTNYNSHVLAGRVNAGKLADAVNVIGDMTAIFPTKGTVVSGLGDFIYTADDKAALVQMKSNPEIPVEEAFKETYPNIPMLTDNFTVADSENALVTDVENLVEEVCEDTPAIDSENPAEEEAIGLEIQGFCLNDSGHIVSYSGGSELTEDGYMCLPWDAACTGIEAGALDDVQDMVYELYIPANIVYIAPGAFDGLCNLLYIYAEPENPVYESDGNGILYRKSDGVQVAYPHGRDGW